MIEIIIKLLIALTSVWCTGLTLLSASPVYKKVNSTADLDEVSQRWANNWKALPQGRVNTVRRDTLPYMNIIAGKSKEWTNFDHSRHLKRSDDLFKKTPFLSDDCSGDPIGNNTKFPCPINLLYGNNLTVKNFFLMMPEGNHSYKDYPLIEKAFDIEKITQQQASIAQNVPKLGAIGNPEIITELIHLSTNNNSLTTAVLMQDVSSINVNVKTESSTTRLEATTTNGSVGSICYTSKIIPCNKSQSSTNLTNFTLNESVLKSNLEVNNTFETSRTYIEKGSSTPFDKSTENVTTPSMDIFNVIVPVLEGKGNLSTITTNNQNTTINETVSKSALEVNKTFETSSKDIGISNETLGSSTPVDDFTKHVTTPSMDSVNMIVPILGGKGNFSVLTSKTQGETIINETVSISNPEINKTFETSSKHIETLENSTPFDESTGNITTPSVESFNMIVPVLEDKGNFSVSTSKNKNATIINETVSMSNLETNKTVDMSSKDIDTLGSSIVDDFTKHVTTPSMDSVNMIVPILGGKGNFSVSTSKTKGETIINETVSISNPEINKTFETSSKHIETLEISTPVDESTGNITTPPVDSFNMIVPVLEGKGNFSVSSSKNQNTTINEIVSISNLEVNKTSETSTKYIETLENSTPIEMSKGKVTTPLMESVNGIVPAVGGKVNFSLSSADVQNNGFSLLQLFTTPSSEYKHTNSRLRDEIFRTVDKYCETLIFNLSNDVGPYHLEPVDIPQLLR